MDIKGKNAIITGASGKLGGEIALGLGKAGCNCICHCNRNLEAVEEIAAKIEGMGRHAVCVQADLNSDNDIEKLFDVAEKSGVAEILVNSASIFSQMPLADVTRGDAEEMLET